MMTETTREQWLKLAAIIVIAFGPVVSLAAHPVTAGLNGLFVDLTFWPLDGGPAMDAPATRLLSAIGGGLTMGWGVMIYLVAAKLYRREPELARSIILASVVTWFLVDSIGSVVAGAPANVIINLVFLLMFVVPLYVTSRQNQAA
jgi:hypothetical protein